MTVKDGIKVVSLGYVKLFKQVVFVALLAFSLLFLSAALVYPLWLLASKAPELYSLICLLLCSIGIVVFALFKYVNAVKSGNAQKEILKRLFLGFLKLSMVLVSLGLVLAGIAFFVRAHFLWALLCLLLAIILFGITFIRTKTLGSKK